MTALHVAIGDDVKDGKTVANAVSGQIGLLRRLLTEATSHAKDVTNVTADSPWVQVVKSDLRLVVRVCFALMLLGIQQYIIYHAIGA